MLTSPILKLALLKTYPGTYRSKFMQKFGTNSGSFLENATC